ncbi:MAG: polysaccharide biosynthesis C-terminal domain-containing protein [Clostridium sp.]
MLLRLVFVVAGIPLFGIYGYLCGMLISEIFLALAHLWSLKRRIPFTWNARDMIAKPAFFLFLATGIHYFIAGFLPTPSGTMPLFFKTSGQILVLSSCYGCTASVCAHSEEIKRKRAVAKLPPEYFA